MWKALWKNLIHKLKKKKILKTKFLLSPRIRGNYVYGLHSISAVSEVLVSVMHRGNFFLSFINMLQGVGYAFLPEHPLYQAESQCQLISFPEE